MLNRRDPAVAVVLTYCRLEGRLSYDIMAYWVIPRVITPRKTCSLISIHVDWSNQHVENVSSEIFYHNLDDIMNNTQARMGSVPNSKTYHTHCTDTFDSSVTDSWQFCHYIHSQKMCCRLSHRLSILKNCSFKISKLPQILEKIHVANKKINSGFFSPIVSQGYQFHPDTLRKAYIQ